MAERPRPLHICRPFPENVLFKCRISSVTLLTRLFPIVDLPEAARHRSRLNPAGSGIPEKKTPRDSM
jgi:hypothetical protein